MKNKRGFKQAFGGRTGFLPALILCMTLLSLQQAYAGYSHRGTASENAFSLASVGRFEARLVPEIGAGNGNRTSLRWYQENQKGEWEPYGKEIGLLGSGSMQEAAITVPVSFSENQRRFRYELRNEAGIVLSEVFYLKMSANGGSVQCLREPYEEDLSERRNR